MKRVVEKPMAEKEREAYSRLETLAIVDSYFLSRALELCPGGKLLDVGCGNGKMLRSLMHAGGSYELHGIDIDKEAIEEAERMGGGIRYASAPAEEIPYESGTFGIVMCHSTLHHMEDPKPAIGEILRVAMPCGAVFIRDLARPASEEILQRFFLGNLAAHYDSVNRELFGKSLRSSFEHREWASFFPPGLEVSQVFFYNIAERAAEGVVLDQQARKLRELEFIAMRMAAPAYLRV
jgi:ubiquinone/menaquinone biosynthesis C-methylase UbiE